MQQIGAFFAQLGKTIVDWLGVASEQINLVVWGPVMIFLLLGTGLYLSIFTGFFQLRRLPQVFKQTVGGLFDRDAQQDKKEGISPFQAVCTALAGTIGTGNIVGVATAIVTGGPGAVFWMWVSALAGTMTKYAEAVLAIKFRVKNEKGEYMGGPMYYIQNGLHCRWLAMIFALLCILASFGIGNITQANAISDAMHVAFALPTWLTGLLLAGLVALVIFGGIQRIAKFTSRLVPFMAVFYTIGALAVIVCNYQSVPQAFSHIITGAFSFTAVGGGVLGYTARTAMQYGFARGVFTNEAGLGSAPIAHAAANTDNPVKQGMWGIFEVFLDTIVMCTLTALVVLTADAGSLWQTGLDGAQLTSMAFTQVFGQVGGWFVALALLFFALSTILGWSYYGERAIGYLTRENNRVQAVYRTAFIGVIVLGAMAKIDLVWSLSDAFNGLMAIPNLIALLLLSPIVLRLTSQYCKQTGRKRRGDRYSK